MTTVTALSNIRPDFDDIAAQLGSSLTRKANWAPLLPTQTASLLIEGVAAATAFLQTGVQNSFEETFPQTARMPSSLRASARRLGVRLTRKAPAQTRVRLTRATAATSVLIPEFSAFQAPGVSLFNRSAILFPVGTLSAEFDLYEGFITQVSYTGQGADSQMIVVSVPGFTISNMDVRVTVSGRPLQVVTDGIWHYPITNSGDPNYVVSDNTLPTGELLLEFGNTQFGMIPQRGAQILVSYAVTNGTSGNNVQFENQRITYSANGVEFTGSALTPLTGGTDELDAEQYRDSPLIYASYERAVAIPDMPAIATKYPGVVDAIFLGQKDIAPNLKEFMNVVYTYVLMDTGSQISATQYTDFLKWWQPRSMPLEYVRQTAKQIAVDVAGTIYITGQGDPDSILAKARAAVAKLFTARQGYLGRDLYVDDLIDSIRTSDPYVDHVTLTSPTADVICKINAPQAPTVTPATGGTLPNGTYIYSVSAVSNLSPVQETFASVNGAVTLTGTNNAARIKWNAVAGAVQYKVYGRTASQEMFLLATVSASSALEFLDTGSVTTGAAVNKINTAGISYVTLNNTNLQVAFTDRVGV